MSWKSIGLSILAIVATIGLLFATTFLFMVHTVLGVIGIVILIVIPQILMRKALDEATGIIDKVIAKYLMPAANIICGAIVVMMLLGLIPFPFQ